jgi:hypothetical protein
VVDVQVDDDDKWIGLNKEKATELVAVENGRQKLQSFKRTNGSDAQEVPEERKAERENRNDGGGDLEKQTVACISARFSR